MSRVQRMFVSSLALTVSAVLVAATAVQAAEGPAARVHGSGAQSSGLAEDRAGAEGLEAERRGRREGRGGSGEVSAEMREKFAGLREMEDREQRRAKMTELSDELDQKAREQLREVLSPGADDVAVSDSHAGPPRGGESDESACCWQTPAHGGTTAEVGPNQQGRGGEAVGTAWQGMRDATDEQRTEVFQKLGKIRSDADEKALGVLTAEQKEAFEKMKGRAEIELPGDVADE